jgi:hypothetical protein
MLPVFNFTPLFLVHHDWAPVYIPKESYITSNILITLLKYNSSTVNWTGLSILNSRHPPSDGSQSLYSAAEAEIWL